MKSPYVVRRPVENAFLVRQRDRRRLRELLSVGVAVLLVGGGLLAYTSIHVEILRRGYRIDDLERELYRLELEGRYRELAITRETRLQRIEERARKELGMGMPSLEQTVFFGEAVALNRAARRVLAVEAER